MKLRIVVAALAGVLGLAPALGCNVSDDAMVKSRILPDDGVEERIRRAANGEIPGRVVEAPAVPAVAPAAAPAAAVPAAATASPAAQTAPAASRDAATGEPLYASYCASCHGAAGAGDGPAAAGMNPKPADHTDGGYMNALSNDHLYKVVDEGGMAVGKSPLMTAWGSVLSEDEIWAVVAYMRALAEPAYPGELP